GEHSQIPQVCRFLPGGSPPGSRLRSADDTQSSTSHHFDARLQSWHGNLPRSAPSASHTECVPRPPPPERHIPGEDDWEVLNTPHPRSKEHGRIPRRSTSVGSHISCQASGVCL